MDTDFFARIANLKIGGNVCFTHTERYPTGLSQIDQWFFDESLKWERCLWVTDYLGPTKQIEQKLENFIKKYPPRRMTIFGRRPFVLGLQVRMYASGDGHGGNLVCYEFNVHRKR